MPSRKQGTETLGRIIDALKDCPQGKTITELMFLTDLSRATVQSYLYRCHEIFDRIHLKFERTRPVHPCEKPGTFATRFVLRKSQVLEKSA